MALDPELPDRPVRLRALHLRRRPVGGTGAELGLPRRTPTHARRRRAPPGRLRRQRPALAPAGDRQRHDRRRAGARSRTGASSSPATRSAPSSSAPTARSTPAAATAPASTSSTTGRTATPSNPCGDPPGAVGAHADPADSEGGALRSQDLRTTGDPVTPRRHASSASIRTPARPAGQPAVGNATPNARRIVAYGLRNPFRFTFRPGTDELWVGDVGWNDWEEINRIARPHRRRGRELRLAVLRGQPAPGAATTAPNLTICENLYAAAGRGHRAVLHLPPQRPGRARRDLSDRQLVDLRARVLPAAAVLSGRVRRCAVLRRLLARLHLGDVQGRQRPPDPADPAFVRCARPPGRPPDRPRRRPVLRRLRRRHDPADHVLQRQPPPVAVATASPRPGPPR